MTATQLGPRNILLTGLARSGTTLTCSLLNRLPNSVALHEPMAPATLAGHSPQALVTEIGRYFEAQRRMIMREGRANSKSVNGRVPSNSIGDPEGSGTRKSLVDCQVMIVDNVTGPDFSVVIKHPAFFTAALPILVDHFPCFAVVRNPLAVLVSWRNSGLPVSQGRVPAAEACDRALARTLAAEPQALERQLIWLDYCFRRYLDCLPGRILQYEDIIRTGGRELSLINPAAEALDEPLQSRNTFFVRRDAATIDIAKRLVDRDSPCWSVYDRSAVEALVG